MITIAILLLGVSPARDDITRDWVDVVELNHFYDENCRLVFDQLIFYDWNHRQARYQVLAWRLAKTTDSLPVRDWSGGGYVCFWQDGGETGLIRKIRAKSMRESWTQWDPELAERERLPKEQRKELSLKKL